MSKVGTLSIPGSPSGTIFTLLNNPGGYFTIQGSDIDAAPDTPAGEYKISIRAVGPGFSTEREFVLKYDGSSASG